MVFETYAVHRRETGLTTMSHVAMDGDKVTITLEDGSRRIVWGRVRSVRGGLALDVEGREWDGDPCKFPMDVPGLTEAAAVGDAMEQLAEDLKRQERREQARMRAEGPEYDPDAAGVR